jgi:hypothetical protein
MGDRINIRNLQPGGGRGGRREGGRVRMRKGEWEGNVETRE